MPGQGKRGSWRALLGFQAGKKSFFLFLDISLTVAAFVSAYFVKCVFRRNPPKWRVRVGVFGAASMNQQSSLKLPLPLKA
jgi:hypothetical protein